MISNQRRNAMKENAENEKELENENPGWNAFLELRRQDQRGPAAGMTLDEINAEIAAARSRK